MANREHDRYRITGTMLAADPQLVEDPIELYHDLLIAYDADEVFDLWATARALLSTFPTRPLWRCTQSADAPEPVGVR